MEIKKRPLSGTIYWELFKNCSLSRRSYNILYLQKEKKKENL